MESAVKVVAGHEKFPLEHEQLIEAGLALVNVKATSNSSGEQEPAKVMVSPEEKNPGSFKLTLGIAEATVTWLVSPLLFRASIVNVGVGTEVSVVAEQLKESPEQGQLVICAGLAEGNKMSTVDPFGAQVPAKVYCPPW